MKVVITGGKRGIGTSITAHFEALGHEVLPLASADLDVTDEDAVTRVLGGLDVDVLVNNAGVSSSAPLKRTTLAEWERQIAVNATGAFLCTRAVLEGMRARDFGRIVTVASAAGHHGSRYTSGYTASKHAVLGFMRAVAVEVAGTGVTANSVCPAYVRSDMTDATVANIQARTGREDGEEVLARMAPLGRLIEPEEVAFAVAFFAAREAGAINGQSLIMDGGGDSAVIFGWEVRDGVGFVTLTGAERKNPLTFESYAALRDHFRALPYDDEVKVVVIAGEQGNFCSGGDVRDIIGPLTEMDMRGLLRFTRMTGDLVKAIRGCPQPVISAIDGVCVGAGAMIATASDIRLGTPRAKIAFLFTRVGLSGADMGACAMLPRIIGQGRAAELLFMGRSMGAEEAERWGFLNRLADPVEDAAAALAASLAQGPTFAHGMTKTMLDQEWDMSLPAAIEAEAQAQAICMQTKDFERAYHAFMGKERPVFEGD